MLRLKELRRQKHISQQALAKAVGSSQSSINSYENDIYEPDINMLIKLANYFDVSIDYLIGNNEVPYVKSAERYMLNDRESKFIKIVREISDDQASLLVQVMREFIRTKEKDSKPTENSHKKSL